MAIITSFRTFRANIPPPSLGDEKWLGGGSWFVHVGTTKRNFHSENAIYTRQVNVQRTITSMLNIDAPKSVEVNGVHLVRRETWGSGKIEPTNS